MKKFKGFAVAAFTLLLIADFAGAEAEKLRMIEPEKDAKEIQIIHLRHIDGIAPAEAVVKPGTTVVWLNESRAPVELQFQGRQVSIACKSPVHFIVDESGSFISDRIPEDSVASLCFVEKGEFAYSLRKAGGRPDQGTKAKECKGRIIVR